jgi:hypothetical protein
VITTIWPQVVELLQGMLDDTGQPVFKQVVMGGASSIPGSPTAWVLLAPFASPLENVQPEVTTWTLQLKLIWQYGAGVLVAESALAVLIDQVRQVFREHVQLNGAILGGRARIMGGSPSWLYLAGVQFRTYDLTLSVTEKIPTTYTA